MIRTIDPSLFAVAYGGELISEFAEGTFIQVAFDADAFTKIVGGQGDVSRVKGTNRSGQVTLTLKQVSPSNAVLSRRAAADAADSSGADTLQITDLGSGWSIHAPNAWILKHADLTFANGDEAREWVLDCDRLDVVAPE